MKDQVIKTVRTFIKGEDKAMVCINNTIYLSQKQVSAIGYKNPKALIGSSISVEYYKVGEELVNGAKCTKADTIIKDFSVEDTAEDIKFAKMANAGVTMSFN